MENTGILNNRLNNLVLAFNRPKTIILTIIWNLMPRIKLNLEEIFKRFTVGPDIPFIKYKDVDRKVSYKIDTQSLITRDTDKGIDDFLKINKTNISPESFFQPFDYGKLNL